MRKCLLFISLGLLLLSSCQKSIVWDDLVLTPPTIPIPIPSGTNGSLLTKMVSLSITDTLTYIYSYDSSKRLIKLATVGVSSGAKVDENEYFLRDASGKMVQYTKIEYSKKSTNTSKYDTSYSKVHYPSGSNNFDYIIEFASASRSLISDSITFAYTNNKITQQKIFYGALASGGTATLAFQSDFGYDASGNVTNSKIYTYTNNVQELSAEATYGYDTKKSPLVLGNEAFITLGEYYSGPNNPISYTLLSKNTNMSSVNINYNITYNANSYPAQATGTATFTGAPSQIGRAHV